MGSRGAILSVAVVFISVMAILHCSTSLSDSTELQVAGVAGDLAAVRAASSLIELVHLGCLVSALMAIAVVLHRKLAPSVRTLTHPSRHQAAHCRAARRTFRRDARDASLIILGIASMAVILSGSATPPLHYTHPILSHKWGPSVHSSATTSPYFVHQGSHQPLSMLGTVHTTPPLRDKVTPLPEEQLALLQPPVAQNGVSGNNILLIWMLSNQEQSLQQWQPSSMSAAAAAAPAAVACTSHTLTVVPQQAMQTAMAETGESSTALAIASGRSPTSKRLDYFHMWTYSIKEQSLQQWQPDMSLSAAAAATTTASIPQGPPSISATASTVDGVSTPIIAKPSGQSSANMLTLWAFWANEQSMQQWQPELFAHAAVVPSTQVVAKPGASAALAAAKQSDSPHAELTTEAAVARSASAIKQGRSAAAPLAFVLSTAQAASPEDVPAELEPVGSVLTILLPVETTTEENYPAVLQWCMGSILGQVLLGVFMLALGGVILPGLCLWWEFGTISPAVGAFIAPIEEHPEPMTLKMKNAGVDASKSLRRKSSLIKARVTRDLPGLPSLQPLHHVLSRAESILARLMRLSSKVGTEEGGEAAAQSGASSATASGGQAAAADNVQPGGQHSGGPQPAQPAQRGGQPNQAPVGQGPQQAQHGADAQQARRNAPQRNVHQQQAQQVPVSQQAQQVPVPQQAQQVPVPQQAQQGPVPQQAQQVPIPQQAVPGPQQAQRAPQQAAPGPQQAQHVPYFGPRQPPGFVPAAAVPAPYVQQMPVIAPAPMPVISAGVTNVLVVAGPELAADTGTQQASLKVQQRVTKKAKALKVLRKLVCLPPSNK